MKVAVECNLGRWILNFRRDVALRIEIEVARAAALATLMSDGGSKSKA